MKNAVIAAVVIVTLVLTGVAVFALYNMNYFTETKPNPVQVTNYSAAINSLKPQINAINNNVSSLNSLKGDISDIRGKLVDLETKINQAQQSATQTSRPAIILDRSVYLQGDTVFIIAVGLDPQKAAQVQLLDNNGYVLTQAQTSPDSSGRLTYNLSLPSTLAAGNYQVKVISGQLASWQPITIMGQTYPSLITLSGPYLFNAQTDQTAYLPSDVIEVFGTGKPYTSVSGVFTSPSGRTFTSNTTIQPDGTFSMFLADSRLFETGLWHASVNNQGTSKVLSFSIGPSIPSSPYPFSAQSDFSTYQAGDQLRISGVAQPNTSVVAYFTSPSGHIYIARTSSSSDGSYQLSFFTASSYELGYWNVNLSNEGQSRGFSIYLASSSVPTSFTAQTDKTIYIKGQQIQISGAGKSYTAVKAELRSPSGTTYNDAVSTNFDGSYVVSFPTSSSYETGNWFITVTNWGVTKVISIFLEP